MQSRNTISFLTSLLLLGAACAHQIPNEDMDEGDDTAGKGGSTAGSSNGGTGGTGATAGTSSTAGKSSGTAGKSTGTGGTGTPLPPAGSGGKAGSGSGGKGGKGGSGGTTSTGMAGAADGGSSGPGEPVNMPIDGITVTFVPDSTTDEVDFVGGELSVNNEAADPLALADLKVRYYFSNEITEANPDVKPTLMVRWARFGKTSETGDATCTGAVLDASSPTPDADSYVEMTCSAALGTELEEGTLLKISWKAGAQGMGKFSQSNDYSLTDPTKILVLSGNTVVWGVAP